MTITGAVTDLQSSVAALAGVRSAPSVAPDQPAAFPFGVSWIGAVESTKASASLRTDIYTIVTEIHVSRRDMKTDLTLLNTYPALFLAAVWADPTLGGTVRTTLSVTGAFAPSEWAGIETRAWHFETRVKIVS